jgi:hypothetical protein
MRKGAIIGLAGSLFGILALFLGFANGKITDQSESFSFYGLMSDERFPQEIHDGYAILFKLFLSLSIVSAISSYFSNKKNLLGILTLISSGIHLLLTLVFYSGGKEAMDKLGGEGLSFGMGMYLLIAGGILGLAGAILALIKK